MVQEAMELKRFHLFDTGGRFSLHFGDCQSWLSVMHALSPTRLATFLMEGKARLIFIATGKLYHTNCKPNSPGNHTNRLRLPNIKMLLCESPPLPFFNESKLMHYQSLPLLLQRPLRLQSPRRLLHRGRHRQKPPRMQNLSLPIRHKKQRLLRAQRIQIRREGRCLRRRRSI